MCGIIGYIGNNVEKNLYNGLLALEYRGYDSAGVAVKRQDICVTKAVGHVHKLKHRLKMQSDFGIGIGHTRWATHGKVSKVNCHPHLSTNRVWAIVHNGIIENYQALINKFNLNLISQTDSEVVAQLLEQNKVHNIMDFIQTIKLLDGSYAICAINSFDNLIYVAKNKSPLYIQQNANGKVVASDIVSFVSGRYFELLDGEFAVIGKDNISFYDKNVNKIKKQPLQTSNNTHFHETNTHHMIQEIWQTPQVIDNIIKTYKNFCPTLPKFKDIQIIGCGTSYHSALMAEKFMSNTHFVKTYLASEYRYSPPSISQDTLAIFVSQSGETADTIAALMYASRKKAFTIAITNSVTSTLAKKAKLILPLCAGPEIAVASTKAYTAQLIVFKLLSLFITSINSNFLRKLITLKQAIKDIDVAPIKKLAQAIKNKQHIFFIGKDYDYINCLEGALKLKEITYINCNAFASGELKHGVLTLITSKTPVIALITNKRLAPKVLNSINEIKARGGKVYIFSSIPNLAKDQITLSQLASDIMPMYSCVYLQLLAYFTAQKKNLNPDKPRNLAKSVTVE